MFNLRLFRRLDERNLNNATHSSGSPGRGGTDLSRIRRGERVDHFETIRVTKDGRQLNISLTVSTIRDAAGKVVGPSKIVRDITERKATEKALREATEAAEAAGFVRAESRRPTRHGRRSTLPINCPDLSSACKDLCGRSAAASSKVEDGSNVGMLDASRRARLA